MEVAFCIEHQQPTLDGSTHCPFVYWVESRHSPEQAADQASKCRVVPAVLVLDGIDVEALREALETDITVTEHHDPYGHPYTTVDMLGEDAWTVWGFARQVLAAIDQEDTDV